MIMADRSAARGGLEHGAAALELGKGGVVDFEQCEHGLGVVKPLELHPVHEGVP